MSRNDTPKPQKRGEVSFRQPPAKLVAARPEDAGIEELNKKLKDNDGFPNRCGGV